jgi:hypothetical protein
MQNNTGNSIKRLAGKFAGMAVLLCGLVMTATSLSAQQPATANQTIAAAVDQSPTPQAAAKPQAGGEAEESAAPAKPGQEGLKVHGHWKIVSKNPDGTIAKTYEFENSLVNGGGGDLTLVSLLSGAASIGEWAIFTRGTGFCAASCSLQNHAAGSDYFAYYCSTPAYNPTGALCFSGLTTTVVAGTQAGSTVTPSQLIFAGTFTPTAAGSITSVATESTYCYAGTPPVPVPTGTFTPTPSTVTPSNCQIVEPALSNTAVFQSGFTGTTLGSAFTFAAGQIVQVSVTITFS